jgi:hypothetical protein
MRPREDFWYGATIGLLIVTPFWMLAAWWLFG